MKQTETKKLELLRFLLLSSRLHRLSSQRSALLELEATLLEHGAPLEALAAVSYARAKAKATKPRRQGNAPTPRNSWGRWGVQQLWISTHKDAKKAGEVKSLEFLAVVKITGLQGLRSPDPATASASSARTWSVTVRSLSRPSTIPKGLAFKGPKQQWKRSSSKLQPKALVVISLATEQSRKCHAVMHLRCLECFVRLGAGL